jgi:hypothetical protein
MSNSVLSKEAEKMFATATIRLQFRDNVMAGVPRHENMLEYYLNSKHMSDEARADFEGRIKAGKLSDEEKEDIAQMSVCVFERDHEGQLCLWHGNAKACMREMFTTFGKNSIKPKKTLGEECAGGRQTFQHAIHVDPVRLVFHRAGKPIMKADGTVDKVKHITDMSGTRSAIGRHEYLIRPELTLVLKWPSKGSVTEEDLRQVWAAAQEDGLGACRSQGFGKFDVVAWDK